MSLGHFDAGSCETPFIPREGLIMNRARNLAAAFVLLLVALTVGSGTPPASADAVCSQTTKAVFYTTDSTNLATKLGANKADCTQYFISITPTLSGPDTGKPRGGLPLSTIHNQGPQYHALAEIRLTQWDSCTDLNCWYAAGVNLHDAMTNPAVGYDPARDTWAINEVGSPSPSGLAKDVFNGALHNGVDARQAFRAFVHGLYDGSSGLPMPGIVFAANAPQLDPDVADYKQKLTTWYSDAPFWEDIQQYVSTWAQETYADPRAWGVMGKSREERTPYLNDYFLHGIRFADQGNDATEAARVFLQRTYLSLANVVYPSTTGFPPDPGSLTGMLRFISAQTYAQRSSLGTRDTQSSPPPALPTTRRSRPALPPRSTTRRQTRSALAP